MPPSRPIISGIDSLFSRIGVQPLAQQYPAYSRDSREEFKIEDKTILATVDGESLYAKMKL